MEKLQIDEKYYNFLETTRHYLHQYPEIGLETVNTAKYIQKKLDEFGFKTVYLSNCNSVIGTIGKIKDPCKGKVICLRSDIDGLPVTEENEIEYKSKIEGRSHACGHDAHMAVVLAVCKYISENISILKNNILKVIFQSAEETPPGGAIHIIDSGICNDVDVIFGFHVSNMYDLGKIWIKKGPAMAAVDNFEITLYGKSAHAGLPHLGIDPITMSAQLIMALQPLISREKNTHDPGVLSITMINSGVAENVIPENAIIKGTIRTFSDETRIFLKQRLQEITEGIAVMCGGKSRCNIIEGYPYVNNDESLCNFFINQVVKKHFKELEIINAQEPLMLAEDFARYQRLVKGLYVFIGSGDVENKMPNHHPKFNINEKVMGNALKICLGFIIEYIETN